MAITRFQDLPSTNTPINSENLNGNFDELGVKVGTSVDNNYRVNVLHSKNLLNYTIPLTTHLGVTTSMSDGKLILDGTTTGDGDFIYNNSENTLLLKAGTYTISATKISGTYQNRDTAIYIRKVGDETVLFNVAGENDYSRVTTITLTEDTLIHLNIYTNVSGMVFTNLVVSLQIERGSTATDFEIPVTPSINVDGETIYTKVEHKRFKKTVTTSGWSTPLKLEDYNGYDFITFYIISSDFKDIITLPIDVLILRITDNAYTITSNNKQYMAVGMYGNNIMLYRGYADSIEIILWK